MGLLAKYYGGGLSILDQKKMFWHEILKWHDIYVLQSTEDEVINELKYDKNGKVRSLPSPETIRELVDERIEERKQKSEEKLRKIDGQ